MHTMNHVGSQAMNMNTDGPFAMGLLLFMAITSAFLVAVR
jgi:hypothetical protein